MALAMIRGVENPQLGVSQQDHDTVKRTLASNQYHGNTHWKTHLTIPNKTDRVIAREI